MHLPEWVNDYIGVPFEAHGRTKEGLDCWGLVYLVSNKELDLRIPSYTDHYQSIENYSALSDLISEEMTPWRAVAPETEMVGDVVLMRLRNRPIHVGLVIAPGHMIHVEQGTNTCIENYRNSRWAKRVIGIYRHESVSR